MERAFLNFVLSCGLVFHFGMYAMHVHVHAVHFNSCSVYFGIYSCLVYIVDIVGFYTYHFVNKGRFFVFMCSLVE